MKVYKHKDDWCDFSIKVTDEPNLNNSVRIKKNTSLMIISEAMYKLYTEEKKIGLFLQMKCLACLQNHLVFHPSTYCLAT